MINRWRFYKLSVLAALLSVSVLASAADKPNIVFINVDDLGWSDLSCQGSQYYQTPHIDKLASQGMTFTNAYAPAANCAPSRACVLTGQYGPRHGVYTVTNSDRGKAKDRKLVPIKNTLHIKPDNLTIGHAMKAAGYVTATMGKWHVSKDPLENGFDINIGGLQRGGPYSGGYHSPFSYPNLVSKEKDEYLTDRITSEAIEFMNKHKEKPFFLYIPYYTVHSPLQAKADKIKKYKNKKSTPEHNNATYAAMIESLDENIGRLMATLDKLGLAQNTLVLFTSDNGGVWKTSKQWPLRAGKGAYYEGGIREPLFVRWPKKIKAGSISDVPVSGIDFFPTFVEAVGGKQLKNKILDGVSLLPVLTNKGKLKDRALFWHFPIYLQGYTKSNTENRDNKFRTRPGSVVRYGDFKLHEYFEDGALELYNLKKDIGEKNNIAKRNPQKVHELYAKLKAWRAKMGAPVPTELNPKYKP